MTRPRDPIYAGHRLSLRMVEEMLAARGSTVTHETIRQWGLKFGQEFANRIRRRAPCRGDKWHPDEVVVTIAKRKHWLWRAVDQDGFVLDTRHDLALGRAGFKDTLTFVCLHYRGACMEVDQRGLLLRNSPPPVLCRHSVAALRPWG